MVTGGGPQIKDVLTNTEEELLSIISSVEVNGDDDVLESTAEFHHDFHDLNNTEIIFVDSTEEQTCFNNSAISENQGGVTEVLHITAERPIKNEVVNQETVNVHSEKTNNSTTKKKGKRIVASQRLSSSLTSAHELNEQIKQKTLMKQNYYNEKLAILKSQTEAFHRIASALFLSKLSKK